MVIIIAGAGRVGFNLARTLSASHNVTVIDQDAEALQRLQESMDILILHGDVEDPATYQKLIDKDADLFIAATDLDETNLISTLIVDDVIEIKQKFISLRNEFFGHSSIKEKLNITEAIFPLQRTSQTVARLLEYPKANNVKTFKYTDFKLLSVRVSNTIEPTSLHPEGFVVVGIERNNTFFLSAVDDMIEPNDLLYLFGDVDEMRKLCKKFETEVPYSINRCVILGAGELGIAIARALIRSGKQVKLVDKDVTLCEKADEQLGGSATTISCKYGTSGLFEDEGLEHAEMFIAATENDEYNIIKCIEAHEHGIRKVVAINNEREYYNLMHKLGIVVVRGPKMSAYNAILESINSSDVVMERKFCGAKASVFLLKIFPDSKRIDKMLKPIQIENATAFLIREGKILSFDQKIQGLEGDVIVAFCSEVMATKVKAWIYGL